MLHMPHSRKKIFWNFHTATSKRLYFALLYICAILLEITYDQVYLKPNSAVPYTHGVTTEVNGSYGDIFNKTSIVLGKLRHMEVLSGILIRGNV